MRISDWSRRVLFRSGHRAATRSQGRGAAPARADAPELHGRSQPGQSFRELCRAPADTRPRCTRCRRRCRPQSIGTNDMRRLARPIAALPALFLASPALAVDTSFHTYDGFAETVDAFRLVSMIFGDPRYETLVMIVATVGIGLGAIIASVRGTGMGQIGRAHV